MPYLIDGHNLIGKMDNLSLAAIDDEQQLIEILQEFCRRERRTAEVYFDNAPPGVPQARQYGRLTAFFTRAGKSADQAIYERLKRLGKEARNWTVVSSDRQVQAMAKSVRAKTISSEEFARQMTAKPSADKAVFSEKGEIDDAQLQEWIDLFRRQPPEKPK